MTNLFASAAALIGALVGVLVNGAIGGVIGYAICSYTAILVSEVFGEQLGSAPLLQNEQLAKACFYSSGAILGISAGWQFGLKYFS